MKNAETIYRYDGSFDGFLCCVFESFSRKEIPADIVCKKETQGFLFEDFFIETDAQKAKRVEKSIRSKIGAEALYFLQELMFSCLEKKEKYMLGFLRLGYKNGAKVMEMLSNDAVCKLSKAARFLRNESHLYKEFIRFSVHKNFLFAQIKPKNFVLPFIAPHFARRFANENFLIHDETHNQVCAYSGGKYAISEIFDIQIPKPDDEEKSYQKLWRMFYDNAAVEGRINHKCRMTNMPKRYWDKLTEFQEKKQR